MGKSQAELRREWVAWRASKGLDDGTGIQYSSGVSCSNVRVIPARMPSNAEMRRKASARADYWARELARLKDGAR